MSSITNKTTAIIALLFLIGGMVNSCGNNSENAKQEHENVSDANKELDESAKANDAEIAEFRQKTSEKLAENEKNLEAFKARIANEKAEARADYLKRIEVLEKKNSDYKKKLADFKRDGKDKWETFKSEFNRDMDELGNALKNLTVKNNK